MLKMLRSFVAVGLALLSAGCLEFQQQTLTYRYDLKTDTFRIFQVYEGIFGGDQPSGLSEKEQEELQSVLSGHRTFFFSNWIMEYDRDQARKELDSLGKPEAGQDAKDDPAARSRRQSFFRLLLDNVDVENGGFYLDGRHRLCGVQRITITRFSSLVASANEQIRDLLRAEANREKVTPEARALYLKSATQQQPFLAIEGNRLHLRLPFTQDAFEKSFGPRSDATRQLGEFQRRGGTFSYKDNQVDWSFGSPSDRMSNLALAVSDKPYNANALDAVRKRSVIQENLDVRAAAKAFVLGAGRERNPARP